jgi:holin-like protein
MIDALILLFSAQLAGEFLARVGGLPVPGPVIGLVLMLVCLAIRGRVPAALDDVATGILRNLSLLFVPVGVGIVQQADLVRTYGLALIGAVIASTVLTLAVTALVFVGVSRLAGGDRGDGE